MKIYDFMIKVVKIWIFKYIEILELYINNEGTFFFVGKWYLCVVDSLKLQASLGAWEQA